MKKTFSKGVSFILATVMCLSLLPITALAADSDWRIHDDGDTLVYLGTSTGIVFPYGIKKIPTLLYFENIDGKSAVTSITIPDSVTSIDSYAFSMFTSLKNVTIPDSVTNLGQGAFSNCSSLESVTIGNGVKDIGVMAFYFCEKLEKIAIGDGVTSIGNGAFSQCFNLSSINIPNNVTSIDDKAFSGCNSLASATIGNGVTSIGTGAFSDCTSLKSITIPDSVTSMGASVFGFCSSLESVVLGNGLTTIESGMFGECTNLKSLTIPDSVISINDRAFGANMSFTVYGYEGSYAQEWVQKSNATTYAPYVGSLTFVAIGGTTKPTEPAIPTGKTSTWAEEQVNAAISNNLVPQNLQTKYTQATTRAEFAALAVTLYEQATGKTITERKTFADTSDINVEKAAAIGVASGVGDNKFDPNAGLTREQAATMLSRLADAIGKPLAKQAAAFNDNGSISSWAIEAVGQIQAAGIMSGVGNNTFDPKGAYTREQSIVTIQRMYSVLQQTATNNPPSTTGTLSGTYKWSGNAGDAGNCTIIAEFKSNGTVVFTETQHDNNDKVYTYNGTYKNDNGKIYVNADVPAFSGDIEVDNTKDTITLITFGNVANAKVFEKVK